MRLVMQTCELIALSADAAVPLGRPAPDVHTANAAIDFLAQAIVAISSNSRRGNAPVTVTGIVEEIRLALDAAG